MKQTLMRFLAFYFGWVIIVILLFTYTLNNLIQTSTKTSAIGASFFLPFIVMFVGLGAPWLLFAILMSRKPTWARDVLANGKQAPATVVNIGDTGISMGRSSFFVTLHLQVQPFDDVPFEANLEMRVSRVAVPRIGDTFAVKYDPDNKEHVLLLSQSDMDAGYGKMPNSPTSKGMVQELASLAELHKNGDLSDAEYDAAKRKLLTGSN